VSLLKKDDILQAIWETVPVGSVAPTDGAVLAKLNALTQELIDVSGRKRLAIDPFADTYQRQVPIDHAQILPLLQNRVVLITGGRGFVGTNLIAKLQQFGVQKIISVDVATEATQLVKIDSTRSNFAIPVSYEHCDVRDRQALEQVFAQERPQVVFHLAAQRLPGLAETQIHQTVTTNIFGCENIIELCEAFDVEACVFSSTGKASRYFTPDIYAASKKIAEWMFSDHTKPRKCLYGIVRFTHVVENSPISSDMDLRVAAGLVSMHAPGRHIFAQNIEESVNLLLKTLTILESRQTNMLSVRDIGWPIDTLDVALHKILLSGRQIPVYFKGIPAGYEKHVFMGQLDLSGDREILPMLNVIEAEFGKVCTATNTVTFALTAFDEGILALAVAEIRRAIAVDDIAIRHSTIEGLKQIVLSSFHRAAPHKLLDILNWGTNPQELAAAGIEAAYHQDTIDLLVSGMSLRGCDLQGDRMVGQEVAKNLTTLFRVSTDYASLDLNSLWAVAQIAM
jgi:NADP-dependent 3-hydroxy acid dehydrogenase YdfG